MDWRDFLVTHWLAGFLLGAAFVAGLAWWLRGGRQDWAASLPLTSSALALLGLGGLLIPFDAAFWLVSICLAALFAALGAVFWTGRWSPRLGFLLGGILLLGFGGLGAVAVGRGLVEIGTALIHLEVGEPVWLLLLVLLPVVVWLSFRSLGGLGPVRRWLAIGLRCALVLFLILALAEVRLRHPNETVTVIFLVDRSLSIPEEWEADPVDRTKRIDRRWERIKTFINDAVENRGPGHAYDKAGVIVFGRGPRLELPPAEVKRLNFKEIFSTVDRGYTDIGAAVKLALASFPEGTGKRIVLLSDGNENLGNAEEQIRIARNNGVQLDVVPLAAGYRNENEVLVQSVEAPNLTEQSSHVPIRVLLRSYNPRPVVGTLTLSQIVDGQAAQHVPPSPMEIVLRPGLTPFSFRQMLTNREQSYTYEAKFEPRGVLDDRGRLLADGLAGDRVENNRATTHVIARGQRLILLVEPKANDHRLLLNRLETIGASSRFKVHGIEAQRLPAEKEALAVFLSKYDCVILANVPAEMVSDDQQEILRSNTYDQGCGLIMIGGPESFGAGGWQGTPVEKALPVDCEIKSLKVQGKGGLVLIMHASEMADGNRWQKEIAKLAIKKLSPVDEVGVLYFDFNTRWHIPLQAIGSHRESLLRLVDKMAPGDMPEFDTGLQMAFNSLTEPERLLATRHVIIISDGDPTQTNQGLLQKMRERKVTVTTVGVATHGAPQDQALATIAKSTGGRFHKVTNPKALPAIYIKETRLVGQSFVDERRFTPSLQFKSGPTEKLPDELPPLYGFVRTTRKEAFPPVQVPILGPSVADQEFPVLAYWNYGLGKAAAFTSDARTQPPDRRFWDRDWADSEIYLKFWEQVVNWSLRAVETGKTTMATEYQDGKVKVTIDARDADNKPLTDLRFKVGVTSPSPVLGEGAPTPLGTIKFEQKNSGVYEAQFKADEAGSYFINVQAVRSVETVKDGEKVTAEEFVDGVRGGVTIPYSPEFSDMESNAPLLEQLCALTSGQVYKDDDAALAQVAASGQVFRLTGLPPSRNLQPIWYWLLLLAGICLFFDVAVRRIAIDLREVAALAQRNWARLRGRAVITAEGPQFMERLKSRKAAISESLEAAHRSARRFEAEEAPVAAAPPGAHEMESAPSRAPARQAPAVRAEQPAAEDADAMSRLLKAKKRVWEERERDK
jgi:uncharacterized membrane protein